MNVLYWNRMTEDDRFVWFCITFLSLTLLMGLSNVFGMIIQWKINQAIASITEVIIPCLILFGSDQLKCYAMKSFKNMVEEAFLLNIYIVPTFLVVFINGSLCIVYQIYDIWTLLANLGFPSTKIKRNVTVSYFLPMS